MRRLEQYIQKGTQRLRLGYTTGSCAAGAAKAAAGMLLGGGSFSAVALHTPHGLTLELELEEVHRAGDMVTCAVRKDAGDDPDVTDGMLIRAAVRKIPSGIHITGGTGVGRVTRPGLACPVGEAAINPGPREQIRRALTETALEHGYGEGLAVEISVPGGEETAAKTFNPRLGIRGGISILGTSGIVEPMSEAALLETIRLEIRGKRLLGEPMLLLTPGNYGRDYARDTLGLPLDQGVKCSNFIGDAVDMAVAEGFAHILLVGHCGKLVKLAAGIFSTHSRTADARMEILAAHGGLCGLNRDRLRLLMDCVSVDGADDLLCRWGAAEAVWASVGDKVMEHLARRGGGTRMDFGAFLGRGLVMHSPGFREAVLELAQGGRET